MKALTICQPYAHLIAIGEKRVENRTWPANYRGPLAIHAGKSRSWLLADDEERYPDMAFGASVAVAQLVDCLSNAAITLGRISKELIWVRTHEHAEGPFCWILDDVKPLPEPIPARGYPSLWTIPPDIADRLDVSHDSARCTIPRFGTDRRKPLRERNLGRSCVCAKPVQIGLEPHHPCQTAPS